MFLESRSAALLVALGSIVNAGGGVAAFSPPLPTNLMASGTGASTMSAGSEIRGRLEAPDRRPLVNGTLVMTPEDSDGSMSSVNATVRPDGSFVFSNVAPGSYLIRALAQTEPGSDSLFALFRVTVRNRDLDGVELQLRPGATISGRLIIDSRALPLPDAPGILASLSVRAPFSEGGAFGDAQTGQPRRDSSFAIRGVMAGAHLLEFDGLAAPWSLKSVSYRGQDITDTGVQADSGQRLEDVTVTVTDVASEISGTVRDSENRGVPNARVLFVPVPTGLWPPASRRFARPLTDSAGRYSVRGLPAGDYRVAAALEVGERDVYRAGVLRAVREQGVAITVERDQARIVDLSVSRLPVPQRVALR